MSNSRNKWKKVAEAKQISKCLVIKWNKARDKIFAELSLNKTQCQCRRRESVTTNKKDGW